MNLNLINPSCKDHIVLCQTNLPNTSIDALKVRGLVYFLVGVVGPIEEGSLATTMLHVSFMDKEPVNVISGPVWNLAHSGLCAC